MGSYGEPWRIVNDGKKVVDKDNCLAFFCNNLFTDGKERLVRLVNAAAGIDDPVVMERSKISEMIEILQSDQEFETTINRINDILWDARGKPKDK